MFHDDWRAPFLPHDLQKPPWQRQGMGDQTSTCGGIPTSGMAKHVKFKEVQRKDNGCLNRLLGPWTSWVYCARLP